MTEVRGDADAALKGIWTNCEVTGMKTVPRRLLVLGEGPVGVQLAQAVHRLGREVTLVKGARNLLVNEARPLSEALAQVLREEGIELFLGATAAARPARGRCVHPRAGRRQQAKRRSVDGSPRAVGPASRTSA